MTDNLEYMARLRTLLCGVGIDDPHRPHIDALLDEWTEALGGSKYDKLKALADQVSKEGSEVPSVLLAGIHARTKDLANYDEWKPDSICSRCWNGEHGACSTMCYCPC